MFRGISKKEKTLCTERNLEILKSTKRGILSVMGDHGYPYGVPMNHYFDEDECKLYFHCGRGGHREDSIKKCSKVSFTTYVKEKVSDSWAYDVESVIVFGEAEIIDDPCITAEITRKLSAKFTDDKVFVEGEIEKYLSETVLISVTPLHISGKKIKEA